MLRHAEFRCCRPFVEITRFAFNGSLRLTAERFSEDFFKMNILPELSFSGALRPLVLGAFGLLMSAATATASSNFLLASIEMPPPNGAQNICAKYSWACSGKAAPSISASAEMALVKSVNAMVNASVKPAADRRQYNKGDYWSLPTASGGDCEDFALLKKRELVRLGVDHRKLLLATVLDRRRVPHAVLVYRSESGDLLLDNLTDDIRNWRQSRYIFLRMQNPENQWSWVGGFKQS